MRVFAELPSNLEDIGGKLIPETVGAFKPAVTRFFRSCIFSQEHFANYSRLLSVAELGVREILISSYKSAVVANSFILPSSFKIKPPANIYNFEFDPSFISQNSLKSEPGNIGELRETYYERTLGSWVPLVKEFHVYDPYAFLNLGKSNFQRRGIFWLLCRKLNKLPVNVTIHARNGENDKDAPINATRREEILQNITREIKSDRETHRQFSLTFELYDDPHNRTHARFYRYVFPRGNINVSATDGTEAFDYHSEKPAGDSVLKRVITTKELSSDEYMKNKEAWDSLASRVYKATS